MEGRERETEKGPVRGRRVSANALAFHFIYTGNLDSEEVDRD